MKVLVLAAVALTLSGCGQNDDDSFAETLWVAPYKVPCVGVAIQLCRLEKIKRDGDWEFAYTAIDGFEPQWGHSYNILVEVTPVRDPTADGSSRDVRLIAILEQQEDEVGAIYELKNVPHGEPALGRDDNGYTFYGEGISCAAGDACTDIFDENLDGPSGNGGAINLQLRYTGSKDGLPLEVVGWGEANED